MNKVFLCKETVSGETRTALIPADIKKLIEMGYNFTVQSGAGLTSGYTDDEYKSMGATIKQTLNEGYDFADIDSPMHAVVVRVALFAYHCLLVMLYRF